MKRLKLSLLCFCGPANQLGLQRSARPARACAATARSFACSPLARTARAPTLLGWNDSSFWCQQFLAVDGHLMAERAYRRDKIPGRPFLPQTLGDCSSFLPDPSRRQRHRLAGQGRRRRRALRQPRARPRPSGC